ncbi:uncharacterized protein TRIADDRAFT_57576 [Trichoplax adhaerens]|uniref:G-protein coupled receptors family 1 profile domain-containing protein n=1 Tax=Trichoplax adhaerens TaxID=10228 RepID=B3RZU0_TRIAD|nr:hypothetical protein TRIADDRAFT_57576 [Trichoplax adhaerens]EDV24265.1 hypothetical protein TRIADDRAFT_57576 [Trichoplax adhaerens]|eukprot:XP_002113791.1 hypothetical protein TRIADDRAFT_57576 [Trichoplax adhaerens]
MAGLNNATNHSIILEPPHISLNVIFAEIGYASIFLLSLLGNILICSILIWKKKFRSSNNVCILNLAIADLMVTLTIPVIMVLLLTRTFIFGPIVCKLIYLLQTCGFYASWLTLLIIAFDRYRSLNLTLTNGIPKKYLIAAISSIWILSTLSAIPPLIFLKVTTSRNGQQCRQVWPTRQLQKIYVICSSTLFVFLPFLLICIIHIYIGIKLTRMGSRLSNSSIHHYKHKVIITMSITSAVFLVCCFPYQLLSLLITSVPTFYKVKFLVTFVLEATIWMTFAHCMCNPVIYVITSTQMRQDITDAFKACHRYHHRPRWSSKGKTSQTPAINDSPTARKALSNPSNRI